MELVTDNLASKLKSLLSNSVEIKILSAFLKNSGIDWIKEVHHRNIEIIVGIDFFITDPLAIKKLKDEKCDIRVFYNPKAVFHPKCYYIKTANEEYLVIGSSNLTIGGMNKNYEASIIVKKEYSNSKEFFKYVSYYNELKKSKYCMETDHEIVMKYFERYETNRNIEREFSDEIEKNYFPDDIPIYDFRELDINGWVFHDEFKVGYVVEIEDDRVEIFFLGKGLKCLKMNDMMHKIKTFSSDYLESYFEFSGIRQFEEIIAECISSPEYKKEINRRENFYDKWRIKLESKMTAAEIFDFFEEAAKIWTLFGLKKNILSSNENRFNEYLNILNNDKISLYKRFETACNKAEGYEVFQGIGRAITSVILNINNINECAVYDNASDEVLKYFGIKPKTSKGESNADRYFRFVLLSKLIQGKYNLRNLMEVDSFIGYVKVNILDNRTIAST